MFLGLMTSVMGCLTSSYETPQYDVSVGLAVQEYAPASLDSQSFTHVRLPAIAGTQDSDYTYATDCFLPTGITEVTEQCLAQHSFENHYLNYLSQFSRNQSSSVFSESRFLTINSIANGF